MMHISNLYYGGSNNSFFVTLMRYLNSPIEYMLYLIIIRALSCLATR